MYFPYFRGKQNELLMLRENAELISTAGFIPIIEPVKRNTNGMVKAITELITHNANLIFVVNPIHGDFCENHQEVINDDIQEIISEHSKNIILGIIADQSTDLSEIQSILESHVDSLIAIIHYGFTKAKSLKKLLSSYPKVIHHIFIDGFASELYRRQFKSMVSKVLIRDGFKKRVNRDHPIKEVFSDLHILFDTQNLTGFGDFTITGDEYSESGGPAYAVAIHVTDLESDEELADEMGEELIMIIRHYVSESNSTPVDPAGKFMEALNKLIADIQNDQLLFVSHACEQYQELYAKSHFPGLGVVKKLSMQHHIELMNHYLTTIREE